MSPVWLIFGYKFINKGQDFKIKKTWLTQATEKTIKFF